MVLCSDGMLEPGAARIGLLPSDVWATFALCHLTEEVRCGRVSRWSDPSRSGLEDCCEGSFVFELCVLRDSIQSSLERARCGVTGTEEDRDPLHASADVLLRVRNEKYKDSRRHALGALSTAVASAINSGDSTPPSSTASGVSPASASNIGSLNLFSGGASIVSEVGGGASCCASAAWGNDGSEVAANIHDPPLPWCSATLPTASRPTAGRQGGGSNSVGIAVVAYCAALLECLTVSSPAELRGPKRAALALLPLHIQQTAVEIRGEICTLRTGLLSIAATDVRCDTQQHRRQQQQQLHARLAEDAGDCLQALLARMLMQAEALDDDDVSPAELLVPAYVEAVDSVASAIERLLILNLPEGSRLTGIALSGTTHADSWKSRQRAVRTYLHVDGFLRERAATMPSPSSLSGIFRESPASSSSVLSITASLQTETFDNTAEKAALEGEDLGRASIMVDLVYSSDAVETTDGNAGEFADIPPSPCSATPCAPDGPEIPSAPPPTPLPQFNPLNRSKTLGSWLATRRSTSSGPSSCKAKVKSSVSVSVAVARASSRSSRLPGRKLCHHCPNQCVRGTLGRGSRRATEKPSKKRPGCGVG